jgi:hypothetical protein
VIYTRRSGAQGRSRRPLGGLRLLMAGCAASSIGLAMATFCGSSSGAASSTLVLHYYQTQSLLKFLNASNVVIQGYPPLGGHVIEDDVDYVGDKSHHAKTWTVSDHLFCTVVTAPATASCSYVFAAGDSIIYMDNLSENLASSTTPAIPIDGGTGKFAGYSGSALITSIGNTNNSNVVITLHRG